MSVGSVLLWILAGILAVLLALLVLPVGVRVCYDVSGLRICLLAGPIRWQLLPAKSKWWFKRRTKDKPAPPARPAGKPAGKPKPAHKGEPGPTSSRICRSSAICCWACAAACWCGGWNFG